MCLFSLLEVVKVELVMSMLIGIRLWKGHIVIRSQDIDLASFMLLLFPGGDSKTLMFVQISPSDQDLGETLSSLNFASRVRGIELGPAKKQIDTSELQKVKAMVGPCVFCLDFL